MREQYVLAKNRAARSRLVDEVCEVTGYHRKAVIRLLRRSATRHVGGDAGALRHLRARLSPFEIAQRIDRQLDEIYRLANQRVTPAAPTKFRVWTLPPHAFFFSYFGNPINGATKCSSVTVTLA